MGRQQLTNLIAVVVGALAGCGVAELRGAEPAANWIQMPTEGAVGLGTVGAPGVNAFEITATEEGDVFRLPQWPPDSTSTVFRLTQVEAEQPFELGPPTAGVEAFQPFDLGQGYANPEFNDPFLPPFDPRQASSPSSEQVSGREQALVGATDVGSLLHESNGVQSVGTQRRSPVAYDPHIRGLHSGQIYTVADGAYWMPVRLDLDSMLSRIDPTLIRDIVVIPGPYGLRYGPGFGFVDVVTYDTPRYCNGYEGHARIGLNYRTNGAGLYGLTTLYGGSSNYGYVLSYSNRTGNDYSVGGNAPIAYVPSSYHNQNFWGQFGWDLSSSTKMELRYQRMDQVDTEYAAQFFDVRYLVSDGFNLAFDYDSPEWDRKSRTELWYNRTRFEGDTERSNKRSADFPVISRVDAALRTAVFGDQAFAATSEMRGYTDGDLASTGARTFTTWGAEGCRQLTLGTDVRYVDQHLHERYDLQEFTTSLPPGSPPVLNPLPRSTIDTNLPRAEIVDPGMFVEVTLPLRDYWTTRLGGRVDWAYTTANDFDGTNEGLRFDSSLPGAPNPELDQNDLLYAFYLSNDVELNCNWTTRFGFGHAQRVPTLTERYADGIFLGIIQNGFSRVIGNPSLRKEREWQVDLSLEAKYDVWRSRVAGFYSWIDDYVTYQTNIISDPSGARLLQTINTDYATLAGVEWYGEVDLSTYWTAFASARYVDGRDRAIEQPLPQIAPLEGRLGFRLEQPCDQPAWGGEMGFRLVDRQHRESLFRAVGSNNGFVPVEVETPGFTTAYLRGFWNVRKNVHVVGGIENLFDRTYVEHLDLRLPDQGAFVNTIAYAPGITPYFGIEWER